MTGRSEREALLVLGAHRSGGSVLTRVLNLLGLDLGASVSAAGASGQPGRFESREIVRVHDELLAALGTSWHDPRPLPAEALEEPAVRPFRERLLRILNRDFAGRKLIGLEDPRMCRLVPLWRSLLADAGWSATFVLICRHPDEVAGSLAARSGMSRPAARLLWLDHMLASERDSRGAPREFVTYEALLADWRGEVRRIVRAAGLAQVRFDSRSMEIDAFLDPTRRHQRAGGTALPGILRDGMEAWARASRGLDAEPMFDELRRRFEDARDLYQSWIEELTAREESRESEELTPSQSIASARDWASRRTNRRSLRSEVEPGESPARRREPSLVDIYSE